MPEWRPEELRGIIQRGSKYWFRKEIQKDLREKFGKRNFMVPLHTTSLAVAITRAAEAREQLAIMIDPESMHVTFADALRDRLDDLDTFAEEVHRDSGPGTGDPERGLASELVDTLEDMRGFEVAKRFHDISHGDKTPIEMLLKDYELEREASLENLRNKHWAIKRTGVRYLQDVPDKKTAAAIVSELMRDETISRNSVGAIARNMSALWGFAESKGLVAFNPWQKLHIKKAKSTKRELTRDELHAIMRSTEDSPEKYKAEVIWLLCHTTLRAGEFVALTIDDLEWIDGEPQFISVKDGKTAAATRRIPIARVCRPLVARMAHHNHRGRLYRYVYARMWKVTRKLLDDVLGAPAKTLDMHSTRRATATALQRSGVPEPTAAAIMGHTHGALSYGLYSAGPSDEQLLEAAEKIGEYFAGSD